MNTALYEVASKSNPAERLCRVVEGDKVGRVVFAKPSLDEQGGASVVRYPSFTGALRAAGVYGGEVVVGGVK
jgi:hypothetical protein